MNNEWVSPPPLSFKIIGPPRATEPNQWQNYTLMLAESVSGASLTIAGRGRWLNLPNRDKVLKRLVERGWRP